MDCFNRMNYAFQGRHPPQELAAMVAEANTSFLNKQQWYADSGANIHVTTDAANLTVSQPYDGHETVGVGNGADLSIIRTGHTSIKTPSSNFLLRDIAYCPDASAHLLSIYKFCVDNDVTFELTSSNFSMKDNCTGAILMTGPSEKGLYPINVSQLSRSKLQCLTMTVGVKATPPIWHLRLGHPSDSVLQRVLRQHSLPIHGFPINDTICVACQLGKSKHLTFSDSLRETTCPLELIHSDLWVSPSPSLSGYRYYVIFIDDFSPFTWMYPLVNKSEVLASFVKFNLLVENQFSCHIKQFQSDNGGEYCSHLFKQFLASHGIFRRLSCPYTSQQNGLAERKHRHLVEMGVTLLAQSGLPKRYWVDAFMTATYIVNRLPTKVLEYSTPFTKLFHKDPDYTYFRSFGCQCFSSP